MYDYPDGDTYPGLLVLRFDAGLFFASADALDDRLTTLYEQADPKLHTVVLDFEGIHFIDTQGADKVAELLDAGESYDVEIRLCKVKAEVKALLRRDGLVDRIGEDRIYDTVYDAAADLIPDVPMAQVNRE